MRWDRLLSGERLGGFATDTPKVRTGFQRDFDRVVFSTAFRRMHGKTQVFPLPKSDITHTRLSHSLEASCLARSLGTIVGNRIPLDGEQPDDLATILAAATLAHDIGNPPFGHSGEDAIRQYFLTGGRHFLSSLTDAQRADLEGFEGNAQGFRLLAHTRPRQSRWLGGLQLTVATLGTFTKYPRGSLPRGRPNLASEKKFGFFQSESDAFATVASQLGLAQKNDGSWSRHPLAFLLEAADDTCYRIIDLEDGYRQGLVPFDAARDLLRAIADAPPYPTSEETFVGILSRDEQIGYLRAKAINNLVFQAADVFVGQLEDILVGAFEQPLMAHVPSKEGVEAISRTCEEFIFTHRPVVEIESAGFEVIAGLLGDFIPAVWEHPRSKRAAKLLDLVPDAYLLAEPLQSNNAYEALLSITDFVAGMTDDFAISTYRVLRGIDLPWS